VSKRSKGTVGKAAPKGTPPGKGIPVTNPDPTKKRVVGSKPRRPSGR
jgi:hypothetical protein